jgi:hypothetical protein
VSITPWLGTWTGNVTATPEPACVKAKPACPNPFAISLTVKSATVGFVTYPTWKCKGNVAVTETATSALQVSVTFADPGPFGCANVQGTLTSIGNGYATWNVQGSSGSFTGVLASPAAPVSCQGGGSCGVAASSPQVVCLSAASCPVNGTLVSTVTVAAFTSGAIAANTPVTIHFLSTSHATSSGAWCQGANGTVKTGRTNAKGLFQFSYTAAGANTPPIASFCMMKVTIGRYSVYSAIDQTNDPAPWTISGSPHRVTRVAAPRNRARFGLTVKNGSHGYVNNDPTTFFSEVPSIPGACGTFSPLVKKTSRPHGRAVLVYHPSTVSASRSRAYCTLIAQEADTGAMSNHVVVVQTR